MSFGSLSQEAHECIAQAMNSIGAKSNSGEGGEMQNVMAQSIILKLNKSPLDDLVCQLLFNVCRRDSN